MKKILLSILLVVISISIQAQQQNDPADSIHKVVQTFFSAMKNADTVQLKTCFSPNAVLQTIMTNKAGNTIVKDESIQSFIDAIGKETIGNADERIGTHKVLHDEALAVYWVPYQFYYKGKFSHCGVNSFQFVRLKEGWKIQYIIDTRRRDRCE